VPSPALTASGFEIDRRTEPREPLHARVRISAGSRIRLAFTRRGEVLALTPWEPFDEGVARVEVPVPPLAPGRYEVGAVATDGVDTVRAGTAAVRVRDLAIGPQPTPAPSPSPRAAPPPRERPGWDLDTTATVAAVGLGALALLAAVLTLRRRIRLPRS
jgi:hypothetical protein